MTGYTKLFGSIVASTIWREPHTVRIVWITMLAMANKSGVVEASVPGLADLARVTLDECKEALEALMSPDEYSRSAEAEGRRIEQTDGGWKIINHAKYRAKMGVDEKREYFRLKKREQRRLSSLASNNVNESPEPSPVSRHAEAQSNTKAVQKDRPSGYAVPACFENVEGFAAALAGWIEHRKKIRKPPTGRAIQLIINRLAEHPERAVKALDTIVEKGWQSFEWSYLDEKRTTTNQRPDSNRNVGHNANRDYSKRTAASQRRADSQFGPPLGQVFRGVPDTKPSGPTGGA